MKISLTDAGKRFNRDWIFRHLTYEFSAGQSYAIIGPNGSGKSTLLQVLSGAMQVNEGNIQCSMLDAQCSIEELYKHVSICAPYLEVVEEMTLIEFLNFHAGFKPFLSSITSQKIISILGLENAVNKQIRNYSQEWKSKTGAGNFFDVPGFLDEPCTNLDTTGVNFTSSLCGLLSKRMVIVSSNDHHEYEFCTEKLNILNWK
jgi:ABC-type multidrug transport system ATPase subunit